jgi:hypothetical protein
MRWKTTTGLLNGAIAGCQMRITHTGILRLAPGIFLPAAVCPGVAANLIGMLPMLNACPDLSLTIEAAAAGAHVCIVRDSQTNEIVFRIHEDRGVSPPQLPVSGAGLLDLAEELDHERAGFSLGLAHALLCMVTDLHLAPACSSSPPTDLVLATSRKCSHGHVHDEFDQAEEAELYGQPCDAELKRILQHKVVRGAPIKVQFPLINTIASQVPPSTATHRKAPYSGQVLCLDHMGPIGPPGQGYPYMNMITDICTGAAIATNSIEKKAQTALTQDMSLRRAHRTASALGGTQRLELNMRTDVVTANTKLFAESQGCAISDFAPRNPSPRGGIERPHQTFTR